jgi:hypothetical protein
MTNINLLSFDGLQALMNQWMHSLIGYALPKTTLINLCGLNLH